MSGLHGRVPALAGEGHRLRCIDVPRRGDHHGRHCLVGEPEDGLGLAGRREVGAPPRLYRGDGTVAASSLTKVTVESMPPLYAPT